MAVKPYTPFGASGGYNAGVNQVNSERAADDQHVARMMQVAVQRQALAEKIASLPTRTKTAAAEAKRAEHLADISEINADIAGKTNDEVIRIKEAEAREKEAKADTAVIESEHRDDYEISRIEKMNRANQPDVDENGVPVSVDMLDPGYVMSFDEAWGTLGKNDYTTGSSTRMTKERMDQSAEMNAARLMRSHRKAVHDQLSFALDKGLTPGLMQGIQRNLASLAATLAPGDTASGILAEWTSLAEQEEYSKLTKQITGETILQQGRSFTDSDRDYTADINVKETDSKEAARKRIRFLNARDFNEEFLASTMEDISMLTDQESPKKVNAFVHKYIAQGPGIPVMGLTVKAGKVSEITFEEHISNIQNLKADRTGNGELSIREKAFFIKQWKSKYAYTSSRMAELEKLAKGQ